MNRMLGLFASIALLAGASSTQAMARGSDASLARIETGKKVISKKKAKKSHRQKVVTDFAGVPQARIRGGDEQGLGPLAFARWLTAHPKLATVDRPMFRTTSSTTRLLNRSATRFAEADADGNGRISAIELADFVAEVPRYRTFNYRA